MSESDSSSSSFSLTGPVDQKQENLRISGFLRTWWMDPRLAYHNRTGSDPKDIASNCLPTVRAEAYMAKIWRESAHTASFLIKARHASTRVPCFSRNYTCHALGHKRVRLTVSSKILKKKTHARGPGESVGKQISLRRPLVRKLLSYVSGPGISSVMAFVMTFACMQFSIINLLLLTR